MALSLYPMSDSGTRSRLRYPGAICAEILYVEDSTDDQILAVEAVEATGRPGDLRIVESAVEMWTTLALRLEHGLKLPAVLVVDLRMPKVGGHMLLAKLAEDEELGRIPVVVLSTSEDPEDISLAHINGAVRYETKPHRFRDLVDTWDRILDVAER